MMRVAGCLLVVGLMTSGCAWFRGEKPPTANYPNVASAAGSTNQLHATPIVTPELTPTGHIARVNDGGRFAVLNFPLGSMPVNGQRLYVYRQGLKVGELKVTGPREDDNTVADIVNGEAQAGDELRWK